jgi:hypothetical protein
MPTEADKLEPPKYPIIYVRGYAFSEGEVEDTVSDPYMGFNLGSTKIRTIWTGATERYYFESPLVRLMKDFGYRDVYSAGLDYATIDTMPPDEKMPSKSIVIYRYYDRVSKVFGEGKQVDMEEFGKGLSELIAKVRDRVCNNDQAKLDKFKVYLVGHSMGGLVIRTFLQNDKIGDKKMKKLVDKCFTYATPHNGIDLALVGNVPSFLGFNSLNNFNRKRMRTYLGLSPNARKQADVSMLDGKFEAEKFFCLIGTNYRDYLVAHGLSSTIAGEFSDGLVRMNNAVVFDAEKKNPLKRNLGPRAYVHRSHSGYFGIVNSEEGFQNLTRFLFGNVRVDGALHIEAITLPDELEKICQNKSDTREIRASYHFECIARVRGVHWDLSRRVAQENSAIFRTFAELFPKAKVDKDEKAIARPYHDDPELFTAYLFTGDEYKADKTSKGLGFTVDLGVLVPDYSIDGVLFRKDRFPGGYIFRDKVNLETVPDPKGGGKWTLNYGFDSKTPNHAGTPADPTYADDAAIFSIPIEQKANPGIKAKLVLTARWWNRQ